MKHGLNHRDLRRTRLAIAALAAAVAVSAFPAGSAQVAIAGGADPTGPTGSTEPTGSTSAPPPPLVDTYPPVITQFKTLFKRFRYNRKGAVISHSGRAHPGTTISLILSEPARVTFTVEKAFRGKQVAGACQRASRRNRKARRCTKMVLVHAFARDLALGANSFGYSAMYYDAKGRVGKLHPGPYRMTAVAVDPAGNVSAPAILSFKIRH